MNAFWDLTENRDVMVVTIGPARESYADDGSRKELANAAPKLAALHYYLVTYPGTNVQELHAVGIWAK